MTVLGCLVFGLSSLTEYKIDMGVRSIIGIKETG